MAEAREVVSREHAPPALDSRSRTDMLEPAPHMWKRVPLKLALERGRDRVASNIRERKDAAREERPVGEPAVGMLI